MRTASQWIEALGLQPHPEGGWFRRVYASALRLDGGRPAATSILYLLESPSFSALHRLDADEQWHFYRGSPLTIHEIDAQGRYTRTTLSSDGPFQHTVPAGVVFGATVAEGCALAGCTVVPGFDYAGFEMPTREELLRTYPHLGDLMRDLARGGSGPPR